MVTQESKRIVVLIIKGNPLCNVEDKVNPATFRIPSRQGHPGQAPLGPGAELALQQRHLRIEQKTTQYWSDSV